MTPPAERLNRRLIVAWVFAIYVLMFLDRVNISIAAKYIITEYRLSDVQMGAIFSAFVLGYALMQVPGGWLADKFGPHAVLTIAILWWSVFTFSTAFTPQFLAASSVGPLGILALTRFLVGFGEAAAPPSGSRAIANWIPSDERGLALGVTLSGNTVGAAIAAPLITGLMLKWGWRAAFYICGAAGVLVAAAWHLTASDGPVSHQNRELANVESTPSRILEPCSRRTVFADPAVWLLTAAYACVGYVLYLYFTWFYLYLVRVRGLSVSAASIYAAAPFALSTLAAPAGGWLMDRLDRWFGRVSARKGLGIIGLTATALCLLGGAVAQSPILSVALFSIGAAVVYATMAAYWSTALDLHPRSAGALSGLMNMGGNLGGVVSPILTPVIAARWGWVVALGFAACIALIGALLWFGIESRAPTPDLV